MRPPSSCHGPGCLGSLDQAAPGPPPRVSLAPSMRRPPGPSRRMASTSPRREAPNVTRTTNAPLHAAQLTVASPAVLAAADPDRSAGPCSADSSAAASRWGGARGRVVLGYGVAGTGHAEPPATTIDAWRWRRRLSSATAAGDALRTHRRRHRSARARRARRAAAGRVAAVRGGGGRPSVSPAEQSCASRPQWTVKGASAAGSPLRLIRIR